MHGFGEFELSLKVSHQAQTEISVSLSRKDNPLEIGNLAGELKANAGLWDRLAGLRTTPPSAIFGLNGWIDQFETPTITILPAVRRFQAFS